MPRHRRVVFRRTSQALTTSLTIRTSPALSVTGQRGKWRWLRQRQLKYSWLSLNAAANDAAAATTDAGAAGADDAWQEILMFGQRRSGFIFSSSSPLSNPWLYATVRLKCHAWWILNLFIVPFVPRERNASCSYMAVYAPVLFLDGLLSFRRRSH